MRPIGTAEELERRHRRAVPLVKQDETPDTVTRILGVGRSALSTWLKLDRESPNALAAKPHPGPTPRLTGEQSFPVSDPPAWISLVAIGSSARETAAAFAAHRLRGTKSVKELGARG